MSAVVGSGFFSSSAAAPGGSNRFGDVFDPASGRVQARVPFATAAEVDGAVRSAVFSGATQEAAVDLGGD